MACTEPALKKGVSRNKIYRISFESFVVNVLFRVSENLLAIIVDTAISVGDP